MNLFKAPQDINRPCRPFLSTAVSQRGANLVDREIDASLEIDEGIGSPDVLMNFIPRDDLPRSLGKHQQHGELLRLELYRDGTLPQFAVDRINFKRAEANYALLGT